jgi:RNA 2',3'-cyclic 3'-phosphodiesterase
MNYRLFLAIDPPVEIRNLIYSICRGPESVKWVKEDQIHLTVRFIGDADGHLLDDICSNLSELVSPAFTLKMRGVGHFPPHGEPKVLWAGIDDSPLLIKLYGKINKSLLDCGIERDQRKFAPHITLGRNKGGPSQAIAEYLLRNTRFKSDLFNVNQYHLYSSRLTPKGAIHEKLASFLLDFPL